MAKLKGAKKAAFLRRMALGRKKATRRKSRATGVRRVQVGQRRRNPVAVIANPSWVPAIYGAESARKPKKARRKKTMAKKRRTGKRRARRASPQRRQVSKARRRKTTTRRSGSAIARVRRGTKLIYINPRKRRTTRRRRNPSNNIVSLLKRTFVPYAAGVITSGVMAVIDRKFANNTTLSGLLKIGGAVVVTLTIGRKHPNAAAAAIGALGASQGYPLVSKAIGGIVAPTAPAAAQQMSESPDPEMGALLQGGVGALLEGLPGDLNTTVVDYETALQGNDDDDY